MRYQVEALELGYGIIDTTKNDGENALVGGSLNKAEAVIECNRLNLERYKAVQSKDGSYSIQCTQTFRIVATGLNSFQANRTLSTMNSVKR